MLELSKVKELLKDFDLQKEDYLAAKNYIRREYKKNGKTPVQENIKSFLERREARKRNQLISELLLSMRTNDTEENYKFICRELKINYSRIKELEKKGYYKKDCILYTWFYYDRENHNGEKILSLKKLKRVTSDEFFNNDSDIVDLVVGHQIGREDALRRLFEMERNYFVGFIRDKLVKFQISYQRQIMDDLINECYLFLYQLVNRIVLRENARIITYIDKRMRGYIHNYVKKNYVSIHETPMYDNAVIGVIAYYETPLELLIRKQQREVMQKAYSYLEVADQKVIYDLYFGKNSLSVWDILDTDIEGEYIHRSVQNFQREYTRLYEGVDE